MSRTVATTRRPCLVVMGPRDTSTGNSMPFGQQRLDGQAQQLAAVIAEQRLDLAPAPSRVVHLGATEDRSNGMSFEGQPRIRRARVAMTPMIRRRARSPVLDEGAIRW